MTKKRFTLSQNGTLHTVRDNVKNKPLGVFEFKDDEFPVYFCFHKIIDLLNDLNNENEHLKQDCSNLIDDNTEYVAEINQMHKENEQLKKELERYRGWINSDKNDYELTLAFIKNKGYSLKDVLEYEKELRGK